MIDMDKQGWMNFIMGSGALILMALIALMFIDVWSYEHLGDCDECLILERYFEMRDGQDER